MHRALDIIAGTYGMPESIVVDGNRFKPWRDVPWQTIVNGDGRVGDIAAASILAKNHRDAYMKELAADYPLYGWDVNKGYPTADHRRAIAEHGPTPHHRMSFRLLPPPSIPGL